MSRAGDNTCLLSRDEERVLSAIPREYATDATKMQLTAHMPEIKAQQILQRSRGTRVYRITIAGSKHPQYSQSARRAQAPCLPVESDRIYQVRLFADLSKHQTSRAETEYIGSRSRGRSILNTLNRPVAHKRHACQWNPTVFTKCYRPFWIRENSG